ncbi:hypothetical protein PLICRDRAFT_131438 [Plicaturopsis crispa FD-325 SS-3]|nr:hypothetical protein PLICRDRAFT_131438 [Plicaturopsis crispa FD-325 SS-3]
MLRSVGPLHRHHLQHAAIIRYIHKSVPKSLQLPRPLAPPKWLELMPVATTFFRNTLNISPDHLLRAVRRLPNVTKYLLDPDNARTLAESMARSAQPDIALRVLSLAHLLGTEMKQSVYECVAHQLAEEGHWRFISPLVSMGKEHTGKTTARLLNWLARAYVELQDYVQLQDILPAFREAGIWPTRRTFHTVVSGHLRNGDIPRAQKCLRNMKKAGYPIQELTHARVVSAYRKLGPDAEVKAQAYKALRVADSASATVIQNSLMKLHIDSGDSAGVFRTLSMFNHHTLPQKPPSEPGQSITPRDGGSSLSNGAGDELLVGPSRSDVYPDAATFTMLLDYMTKQYDYARGLRVYENMVAAKVPPDAGTVASLVRLHFMANDATTAVRLAATVCHNANGPNKLFKRLELTAGDMDRYTVLRDVKPTVHVFNALMRGLLVTHGLKSARLVLLLMHSQGIAPNATTIEIILSHMDRKEHAPPDAIISFLLKLSSDKILPTLRHLHVILRSLTEREDFSIHGSGWRTTAKSGARREEDPSRWGYASLAVDPSDPSAGIPIDPEHRHHMRPILDSLLARNIRNDRATLALRMKHDAVTKRNTRAARDVFEHMLSRGLHPSLHHYAALMEGQALLGDIEAAEATMAAAARAGFPPNVVLYTILIVGHVHRREPEAAMRRFQRMVSAGIAPDVPAIDAVASAYYVAGSPRMARRVLLSLWPLVRPVTPDMKGKSLKELARELRMLHNERGRQRELTDRQRNKLFELLKELAYVWGASQGGELARTSTLDGWETPADGDDDKST